MINRSLKNERPIEKLTLLPRFSAVLLLASMIFLLYKVVFRLIWYFSFFNNFPSILFSWSLITPRNIPEIVLVAISPISVPNPDVEDPLEGAKLLNTIR